FSPDGATVAAGASLYMLLWDTATGSPLGRWGSHPGAIQSIAFSSDGRDLVSCANSGGVRVWDVASRKLRLAFESGQERVWRVLFAPDGRTLVSTGRDGKVRQHDLSDVLPRKSRPWAPSPPSVAILAVSPDRRCYASLHRDHTIRLWDDVTNAPGPVLAGQWDGPV